MNHPLSSDSHPASGLPRSLAVKPRRTIEDLFGTRRRETRNSSSSGRATESVHHATYAIASREVAAVRIGVGRGARHEIILRSGVRLLVTYAQATHLADKIWDGIWPGERRNTTTTRRKAGLITNEAGTGRSGSRSKIKSKSRNTNKKGSQA